MSTGTVKKTYSVFIVGWAVLFLLCSILSALAFSSNASDSPQDTTVLTTSQQTPVNSTQTSAQESPTETTASETTNAPAPLQLPYSQVNSSHVIYIDAGHGWFDNGCSILDRTDIYEKDITLALANRLKEALTSMGYIVRMTRENDESCVEELIDGIYKSTRRIQYANNKGYDYFISIHADTFDNPSVCGTRIYYLDRFAGSQQIAEQIANSIAEKMQVSKPVLKNDERYNVLTLSNKPAILIEAGFVSNEGDAAKLLDENWQINFTRSVALGIDAQINPPAETGTAG